MGQLESDGIISANQMTEDLNTKNPLERARLTSKNEEFAIVGDRVLGQPSFQELVFRCLYPNFSTHRPNRRYAV